MSARPAIAAGTLVAAAALARQTMRNWGATKAECALDLPGDDLVPEPAVSTTRAITIDAPPEAVWPWLVQIGQDKGGLYSYDWIENLLGLDIHSADRIEPNWQYLEVGDLVRLVRPGWLGLPDGYVLEVARVEPPFTLVLSDDTWHSVWSFHLRSADGRHTRLVSRSRGPRAQGAYTVAAEFLDPITLVMTRAMLRGIKRRAEAGSGVESASSEQPRAMRWP